jgi:hypothetical protein
MIIPTRRSNTTIALLLGVSVTITAGCSDGRPERVPISGKVLIDGVPLEKAFVKFVPADGRPAIGETDSNGRFSLTCYEPNDGAMLGTNQVAVIAVKEISSAAMMWRAPKKYADSRASGIEVVVEEPKDDLTLNLTWDGGKPFVEREGRNGKSATSE